MLSYVFIRIIYALIRFYMHSTCYNMLLKAKVSQQQEEMMLALCITGFCFAEAGKKKRAQLTLKAQPNKKCQLRDNVCFGMISDETF